MLKPPLLLLPSPPSARGVADAWEPRPTRFPDPCPSPDSVLHCFTVLPPAVSPSGSLEVGAAAGCVLAFLLAS